MKKLLFLLISFSLLTLSLEGNFLDRQREKFKNQVKNQHKGDLKKKQKILNDLGAFQTEVNKILKKTDSKTTIEIPIEPNKATDVKKTDHFHTNKKVPPKQFGFVTAKKLRLRALYTTKSAVVGYVLYGEKIEVLAKSKKKDYHYGIKAHWFFIKKKNNDEGWVFGAFLQKKKPSQYYRPKRKNSNYVNYATKGFYVPLTGRITSRFGYRVDPVTRRRKSMHTGIDIAAPKGTPVKAAADGIIKRVRYSGGYGRLIIVQHEKDLVTYYGHLSAYRVRTGQRVSKGDIIGLVGSSGRSTGPHLHFEVRRGGQPLNPNSFIR